MTTVSICIPSYNHARFLPAALDSALGQTYRDFEVVVVDDGSTDDSLEIARAYARRHPERVRVFTHPEQANRGISATANEAFARSRGRYWTGLPSDDIMRPDRLARQVGHLERHPEVGMVYSYARYVGVSGEPMAALGLFGVDITRERNPLELLIPGNLVPGMTVLARRECLERIGGHEPGVTYSDWEFWVRLFASCRVGFVARVLMDHRLHDHNTSRGVDPATHRARFAQVIEMLKSKVPAYPAL